MAYLPARYLDRLHKQTTHKRSILRLRRLASGIQVDCGSGLAHTFQNAGDSLGAQFSLSQPEEQRLSTDFPPLARLRVPPPVSTARKAEQLRHLRARQTEFVLEALKIFRRRCRVLHVEVIHCQ
jgi:hypothetical protein